ncbi:hypothetical protein [Shewanella aestuarii]|uniref:Uncharacterized protein n=1 Tax=Shewanella aestuarii TaxID=1028752 RepID=A0A6G9QJW0_9GAMM|nr:hypothetical protein [Shewanella aestuarii]QIR14854.1 hypothetical protein HBH39_10445 [Shewanella aestuarii]
MIKTLGVTLASLLVCNVAMAEQNEELVFKSVAKDVKVFEQYGLNDDIPKLGMSSMSQGENLVEHAFRSTEYEGEVKTSEIFLVQSTDTKGNIDLRIKYDPSKLDEDEDVISRIEEVTKTEYLLRKYAESMDRSTLKVAEKANGEVEIRFNYSKYQLPQNIAYFRFMQVALTAKEGKAIKMVISNSQPFVHNDLNVTDFNQITYFDYLDNGKVYIKEKVETVTGTKKRKPITLKTTVKTIALYDNQNAVEVIDADLLAQVSDPRIREEKVNINRPLPLMADLVRRQGIDVPLPYGFSVAMRRQDMDVPFTSFDIMGINLDEFFDPATTTGVVTADSLSFRADVNILPFWNLYAIYGKIKVDASIAADYTGNIRNVLIDKLGSEFKADLACALAEKAGLPICSPAEFDIPLELDYDVVGVGTTLSVGYREFFASVNATYSSTKLRGQDWGDGIITAQPMLGYQFVDYRAQVFVGAEYQGLKANMTGNLGYIDELERDFTFDVGVKLNQWAYLIGFNKQIGKHYNISALYNKGETRSAYTLNFGYRF